MLTRYFLMFCKLSHVQKQMGIVLVFCFISLINNSKSYCQNLNIMGKYIYIYMCLCVFEKDRYLRFK